VPSKERPPTRSPKTHSYRARLGQNFLIDQRVEQKIVDALGLGPEDTVFEIGAGRGNMTELVAQQAAAVVAVELDWKLAAHLRKKFEGNPKVRVLEQDILELNIDNAAREAGKEKIKVFGNLPYYITSPCLMHLFHYHRSIEEIVVMVQEEVARRIVAKTGSPDYGLLSLTCQYYTQAELLFTVGPRSFSPPPKVRSGVVRMRVAPRRDALGIKPNDEWTFWSLLRQAFSQRRKTLYNNWKAAVREERLRAAMDKLGIDARSRAEALSLEQFAALFEALSPGPQEQSDAQEQTDTQIRSEE
jgi:16S rRNA (adenine1518-N6/adenine1519-N6)-dimethyltransferase